MTAVIGTAGHIDHGKTTLLRALTGIDADRLPEERRRGMTIDVGYAYMTLPEGTEIDFVDVPGHDRLVGNMLVGAGEIDAAMLVVAADDGPRAQTIEHLELLDALGIGDGLAVVTKIDTASGARVNDVIGAVRGLLEGTALAGAPIFAASGVDGTGIGELRVALTALAGRLRPAGGPAYLAVDRSFSVRGRGTVVTGTLRGGPIAAGDVLRLEPGGATARIREVQVHGRQAGQATGGRTALNLAGVGPADVRRGVVLTADPDVAASDRLLVAPDARRTAPSPGAHVRLHIGTDQVGAVPGRYGGGGVLLRLERPVAAAPADRFVLRDPAARAVVAGGRVLDPAPPRGVSRRRATAPRLAALAAASTADERAVARLALHGVLGGRVAPDLTEGLSAVAVRAVEAHHAADPDSAGIALSDVRRAVAIAVRRAATITSSRADRLAAALVDALVRSGRLEPEGERLRHPSHRSGPSAAMAAALARLENALAVAAPPSFAEAIRTAGCPAEGVRALETSGRIVRLERDLAYAASTLRDLQDRALALARRGPLTPARFRDATGTSRKYVLAVLEDLERRRVLRRTPEGHVLGPRAAVLDHGRRSEPAAGRLEHEDRAEPVGSSSRSP